MNSVRIENFTIEYSSPVIKELSGSLEGGMFTGIVGRNGSGKTTLLRGIMGYADSEGKAVFQGKNLPDMKKADRAEKVSMLTQQTEIIEGISAGEIIVMGRNPYRESRRDSEIHAEKAAELLGITGIADRDYSSLSQGQKQLVQICRVLVQDTPAVFLDEPDAYLDFDNKHKIMMIMKKLAEEGKTVAAVIHNPVLALTYCHRIILIHEGKVAHVIRPDEESCEDITDKLSVLYPDIEIKKDIESGTFYNVMKRGYGKGLI